MAQLLSYAFKEGSITAKLFADFVAKVVHIS